MFVGLGGAIVTLFINFPVAWVLIRFTFGGPKSLKESLIAFFLAWFVLGLIYTIYFEEGALSLFVIPFAVSTLACVFVRKEFDIEDSQPSGNSQTPSDKPK